MPLKQHRHSSKVSQMQKNSAETTRSCTGSPARSPSPSHIISPLHTCFDHFSPLGRVYSCEDPCIPIDPFCFHTPLSLNPFVCCFGARAQQTHKDRDLEAAPLSQSNISCTCACVLLFGSTCFHSMQIFAFNMLL